MRRFYIPLLLPALWLLAALGACNSPEDALPQSDVAIAPGSYPRGVLLLNEGNFDWGKATLTHFDPETGAVSQDIFRQQNGFELGNVGHHLCLHEGLGYICLNNSQRIEVVEPHSMRWKGRIELPRSSPRQLQPLPGGKAYVTDLYGDCFHVVDLQTRQVRKKIPASGWTEDMALLDGYVYMTQTRTSFDNRKEGGQLLLKIEVATDAVVDSLALPAGPIGVQADAQGKLWVLCQGSLSGAKPALVRIDPKGWRVEQTLPMDNQADTSPGRLCISADGRTLYYLNGGVYAMPSTATALPAKPLIPSEGRLFYGLDVDPKRGDLYVTDAVDYVQQGWAFRFRADGTPLGRFKAGVIPKAFAFL